MKHVVLVIVMLVLVVWAFCSCDNGSSFQKTIISKEGNSTITSEVVKENVFRTQPVESTILNEHRVYLWDVSESLNSNGLWNGLKAAIKHSIEKIQENPNNKISIVTFYSSPFHEMLNVNADASGKAKLLDFIEKQGDKAIPDGRNYTNIISAFDKFEELIIPGYKNYMFLYTDGGNEDPLLKKVTTASKQSLFNKISKWDTEIANNRKVFGFYVLVDQKADEDRKIEAIANNLNKFHVVPNANVSIKIIGFSENYHYNVYKNDTLDKCNQLIGITGDYSKFEGDIKLEAKDSLYNISFSPNVKEGWVKVNVTPKRDLIIDEGEYPINVTVGYEGKRDPYSFFENSSFIIRCINKREHFADVNLILDGQKDTGKTFYYPSFCFGLSDEKIISQKAVLDVRFNVFAERKNSTFDISFVDGDKNPLKYDEFKIVADGDTLSSENPYIHITGTGPIHLEFIPSKDIDDKHFAGYIVFSDACEMDRINEIGTSEEKSVILEWNFKHEKEWNPLGKIVMIVCLLGLLLLVIWFLFLQKCFFRRFRNINKLLIVPNQAPIQLHFGGVRMIVLSPHKNRQSVFDRFFKGKIVYKTVPTLPSDICMKPTNRGKSISFHASDIGVYTFIPNPVGQFGHATIINNISNIQYHLN